MLGTVCLAFLLLVIPSLSAQEPGAPDTNSQQGAVSTPAADAGAGNPPGGGIGSGAPPALERIGKGVTAPRVLHSPDPAYPDDARKAEYSGTVVLWMVVDRDGTTKHIRVSRSLGMGLDEAAMAAVETWRFQPSTKDGRPVAVQINVEVNFKLDGVQPIVPLHSTREASDNQPQFPGADLRTYPLVFFIGHIKPVPMGKRYEIWANASPDGEADLGGKNSLDIFCESKKKDCSMLWRGFYPARWIVEGQRLEIIGQRGSKNGWEKAEYTVKPAANP